MFIICSSSAMYTSDQSVYHLFLTFCAYCIHLRQQTQSNNSCDNIIQGWGCMQPLRRVLTLILPRSRTGTVWFYTSTSNKRVAGPKLYTESLTRDLKLMYSRFTLVRISINLNSSQPTYDDCPLVTVTPV